MNGALRKIMDSWGSRLTWTVQRQHAAQIVSGMESFHASASFQGSYESVSPGAGLDLSSLDPAPVFVDSRDGGMGGVNMFPD